VPQQVNEEVLRQISQPHEENTPLRMEDAQRMRKAGRTWCTKRGERSIKCPFHEQGCPTILRDGSVIPHVLGRHRELLSVAGVAAFVAGVVDGQAQWSALQRIDRISALEETVAALRRAVAASSQRLEAGTDALNRAELPLAAAAGAAAAAAATEYGYCDSGGSWEGMDSGAGGEGGEPVASVSLLAAGPGGDGGGGDGGRGGCGGGSGGSHSNYGSGCGGSGDSGNHSPSFAEWWDNSGAASSGETEPAGATLGGIGTAAEPSAGLQAAGPSGGHGDGGGGGSCGGHGDGGGDCRGARGHGGGGGGGGCSEAGCHSPAPCDSE